MYHGLNFQKFSHLRICGSFDWGGGGGGGVEKEMTIGCFAWQKWEWTSSLKDNVKSENFLFHRTEGSNCEMFEITWQVSTSTAVLH